MKKILCCLFLSAVLGNDASAVTITVNDNRDAVAANAAISPDSTLGLGVITLRSAIQFANALPGADVIQFTASLNTVPITLTIANPGGINEDAADSGDLDVTDSLAILGNGSANTIIQAGTSLIDSVDKVFSINPFCDHALQFTLAGVTVQNGQNTQPFGAFDFSFTGAGLDWCGTGASSLTITDCVIDNNSNVNGYGGGINIDEVPPANGTVLITRTTIQHNSAAGTGAGINIFGDAVQVTIADSFVLNNTTTGSGGEGANGAGINVRSAGFSGAPSLTLINTQVTGNSAAGPGGGLAAPLGGNQTVSLSNSNISGNSDGDGDPTNDNVSITPSGQNVAPVALCKNVVKSASPICLTAVSPSEVDNGSSDPGDIITLSLSPAGPYPTGTTVVILTATDSSGLMGICAATITIIDDTPPSINCPTLLTHNTDPGRCSALVPFTGLTAGDNCPGVTVSCLPPDGSEFSKGSTPVNCTAMDAAGLTATCSFTVVVVDNEAPTFTPPANVSANTDPGQCAALVQFTLPVASDNCPGVTVSCNPPSGSSFAKGSTAVLCTATDASSHTATCTFNVVVHDNEPPMIGNCPLDIVQPAANPGECTAVVRFDTPTATDNCPGVTVSCSPPSGSSFPAGPTTVTCTAVDTTQNQAACMFHVTVQGVAPVVTITAPASGSLYSVGTAVQFKGAFTVGAGGTHTALWTFTAGSQSISLPGSVVEASGVVTATQAFSAAGVYLVTLTVTDSVCGLTGTANTVGGLSAMVVIYDPNAGFVTGGGWINSPPGAYVPSPSVTGKASFGFVSKYQHGNNVPTGNTEFQFHDASFNFSSTSYDWMVISGSRAQYKGSGTVNGAGNYGFILTATDGQINGGGGVDKFRIKIWDSNHGNGIVYDNQLAAPDNSDPTTALGGGSIVIHPQ